MGERKPNRTPAEALKEVARLIENDLAMHIGFLAFKPPLTLKLRTHWWSSMQALTSIIGHSPDLLRVPALRKLRKQSWEIKDPRP